jgi:hypothetical protein
MNKPTSVQFLIEKIDFDANVRCFSKDEWKEIFEQANAMHKEEIVEFTDDYVNRWCDGDYDGDVVRDIEVDEYYNEKFGGKNE